MSELLLILLATGGISALSLSGVALLFLQEHLLRKVSVFLVAFAAGALMGAAFLHLLPEALAGRTSPAAFLFPLFGFVTFFLIEKTLHWHHSHRNQQEAAPLGMLSLAGDFLHNFLDGIILAATFMVDVRLGLVATAAVALHEIPQEISEFGVLVYAGFSKYKALLLNFLSATTVIAGGIVGYAIGGEGERWIPLALLFAVGTFLYLAASDFVPEIRKEERFGKSFQTFLIFLFGIFFMWLFTFFE